MSADGVVTLSSLLLWYGADFGSSQEEVLSTVARLMPSESAKRARLERLLSERRGVAPGVGATLWNAVVGRFLPSFMARGAINVQFAPYNWELNSAG